MKEISSAIIAVMKDIEGVSKSMTVGSGSSSYKGVSDKDVRLKIRESMINNGLSILPIGVNAKIQIDRWEEVDQYSKSTPKDMKTKQSCFTEVETKYLLLHTSGESLEVSGYGQGVDTQDKGAGKATTYALKNTLLNMFLIPTGVDTDDTHSDDLDVPQKKEEKPKYEDDDKPWFNDPQFDTFQDNAEKYSNADDALKVIRTKYRVGKEMAQRVKDLY